MKSRIYDVVVVGGGVIGAAVAYYLSCEQVRVCLVEKNELSSGTTQSNQANIAIHDKIKEKDIALTFLSISLYEELKNKLEEDIEWDNTPALIVAEDEHKWLGLKEMVKKHKELGIKVSLLGDDDLRKAEPLLAKDLRGGAEYQQEFQINPFKLTFGLIQSARHKGTEVRLHTALENIVTRKNRILYAETSGGRIKTECIVNAAGVWSDKVGSMVDVHIPIIATRGQLVVTELIPHLKKRRIGEVNIRHHNEDVRKFSRYENLFQQLGLRFVFSQRKNGTCLIGRCEESVGYNKETTFDAITKLSRRAVRFLPFLKNISCIRTFAGLRPQTTDGLPILGESIAVKGFIVATGFGSQGLTLGPAVGKLVSELIVNNKTSRFQSDFDPSRFSRCL